MCGIIGIVANNPVNQMLYDGLLVLQHRGQDAAGIATCSSGRIKMHKNNGLVKDVFHTRHMRNLTGNIGLEVYNDVIPANNLAVLFDYPGNVTFQVIDPAPSWLQNSESKGTFVSSAQPFSKNVAIENFGNTDVTADTYVITELLDMNSVVIWASSDTISSLSAGQSQTISYSNIGPIAAGQYYFRTTTSNSSDLNNGNNILVSEIEVLDV